MTDFIDIMVDGINKGIATASAGSKTMLEKNRINTIIKNLENEQAQLINIIGNKIYEYCSANEGDIPREVVASICGEIEVRSEQIAEQRKMITMLDVEMSKVKGSPASVGGGAVCSCGHHNNMGARFCSKCGQPLV